jgi:hypothetical protein
MPFAFRLPQPEECARPARRRVCESLDRAAVEMHPAFPRVRNATIARLVALFQGDYLLNRLLLEEGRFISFQYLLSYGAGQTTDNRESWLTLGRLQSLLSFSRIVSRNRIESLVGMFERYAFIEKRRVEDDLRISLLVPASRMWMADAGFLKAQIEPLVHFDDTGAGDGLPGLPPGWIAERVSSLVGSEGDARRDESRDPLAPPWATRTLGLERAAHRNWRKAQAPHLEHRVAERARHRQMVDFTGRDGGYLTLLLLLDEVIRAGTERISLPFDAISGSTGVSRTHARLTIEEAEGAGFVRLHARGGRDIEIQPHLWAVFDAWIADDMLSLLRSFE